MKQTCRRILCWILGHKWHQHDIGHITVSGGAFQLQDKVLKLQDSGDITILLKVCGRCCQTELTHQSSLTFVVQQDL